jgi:hypothetical protein
MHVLKRSGEAILLASVIFLIFIVLFESRIQLPSWLHVAGRMHPMFLHFPIVLLLIYFITLLLPANVDRGLITGLGFAAALTSVLTAIMGMILSLEQPIEGNTLSFHKWGGIAIAIISTLFYRVRTSLQKWKWVGRFGMIVATMLILLTGHWGATLTHGENYLLQPIAGERVKVAFSRAVAFTDVIQPVLEEKCINCHSSSNKKGGLSLSDSAGVAHGGKTGPTYISSKPDSSLIIQRIMLPLNHKKHMAPRDEPQVTDEELQLLRAWIRAGAPYGRRVADLPPEDTFRLLAAKYLAPADAEQPDLAFQFAAASSQKVQSLNTSYRVVRPLGTGSPALSASFYGQSSFDRKSLSDLLDVKEQLVELNLAKMPVNDDDMKVVEQMRNLRLLNLNYTAVTDSGLSRLKNLNNLRSLSLSGTRVSQAALQTLLALPEMKNVYLWDTKVDSATIAALSSRFQSVRIESGYHPDKDTTTYTLTQPIIKTKEGIFLDSVLIDLRHGIRDVEIRYSLDGSTPDSVNSLVYKGAFRLDSSAQLRAKAYKKGWHSSPVSEKLFLRSGVPIAQVEIVSPPDSTFDPKSPMILVDGVMGNPSNHQNDRWYGYKTKGEILLKTSNAVNITQVWVMLLKNIGGSIFPAEEIEVWGGMDAESMKLLSRKKVVVPEKYDPTSVMPARLIFDPVEVRVIRLVVHPVKKIPKWHYNKGNPSISLITEVVVQ